jgi:methionyl-tRNA formyltransferase
VLSDARSWINAHVPSLVEALRGRGDEVRRVHDAREIEPCEFTFILGYERIIPGEILALSRHNLVVHESALPKGRGWSPLTWQILAGRQEVPIVLFEAAETVDSGPIYLRDVLRFRGDELVDELRRAQGEATVRLCLEFAQGYPGIVARGEPQQGEPTYYPRRTPQDSRLDPDKTIAEQFDLLRVVDNERYPAFFELRGGRYILHVYRKN